MQHRKRTEHLGTRAQRQQRRAFAVLTWVTLGLCGGCDVPPLNLESKSCPCAVGWTCDTRTNTCQPFGSTTPRASNERIRDEQEPPAPLEDDDASVPDSGSAIEDPVLADAGPPKGAGDQPPIPTQTTCLDIVCGSNAHCSEGGGAHCECDAGFMDDAQRGVCKQICGSELCGASEVCVQSPEAVRCLRKNASCAAVLAADRNAVSGPYSIDPDGAGGDPPLTVRCDMNTAGGGWTQVAAETFDSGTASGWSDSRVDRKSDCAARFGAMLGGPGIFGRGASTAKTFMLEGIPHSELRASVDYIVIDSWDDEAAQLLLDDVMVVNRRFSTGTSRICGSFFVDYGRVTLTATQAHKTNLARLTVTSSLDGDATDESFGITDVKIWIR